MLGPDILFCGSAAGTEYAHSATTAVPPLLPWWKHGGRIQFVIRNFLNKLKPKGQKYWLPEVAIFVSITWLYILPRKLFTVQWHRLVLLLHAGIRYLVLWFYCWYWVRSQHLHHRATIGTGILSTVPRWFNPICHSEFSEKIPNPKSKNIGCRRWPYLRV